MKKQKTRHVFKCYNIEKMLQRKEMYHVVISNRGNVNYNQQKGGGK